MILLLTVIGPDRPGLVESLSALVARHQGNWLESRMAHLGGQFAGIVRIELPADTVAAFESEATRLGQTGLRVHCVHCESDSDEPEVRPQAAERSTVEVVGQDRPGIIRQIARVLASHGVNVEELTSRCESAPMSGENIFAATIEMTVPPDVSLERIRESLEAIGNDLMVDVIWR